MVRAFIIYVMLGIALLGGRWSLPMQFIYAGLFPAHWFLYHAFRWRMTWLPILKERLWWLLILLKLFVAYLLLKWWTGYPPWEVIGDWYGELFP